MAETKTVSNNTKYLVFAGLAIILLVMGLILSPSPAEMMEGYNRLITHPSTLDLDGLQVAGQFGTAFFNAGMLLLVVLLVYKITGTDIQGVQIAAAMMVVGFSFYGKNILNIWFPVIGVLLHTAWNKKPLSGATALAWFSTALSPVFSVMAYGTEALVPGSPTAIIAGALFGLLAGMLVSAFAGFLPTKHDGYVLYNAGFAAGLAAMLINALQKALAVGHDKYPYVEVADAAAKGVRADYVSGSNGLLGLMLAILFLYLIIAGFILKGGVNIKKLIWHKCKGGNFVAEFGFGAALINMGAVGLLATIFVFLTVKGQLAGPVFGCIWTAAGFAAAGVTIRMYLPTMLGVYATAFLTGGIAGVVGGNAFFNAALTKAGSRGMLLAAIFSCGLAPIVGDFGFAAGLFVGAVHSVLVPNLGVLHGWMSLYNNGFSLSLIATFLYPLYSKLRKAQNTNATISG